MKRRLIKLLGLLLLGAALNVAVAWGLAFWPLGSSNFEAVVETGRWFDSPWAPSRLSRASINTVRSLGHARFEVAFPDDVSGDWNTVPSLDRETPAWVDQFLTDADIDHLENKHHWRVIQAAGWPALTLTAYFDTDFSRRVYLADWAVLSVLKRSGTYNARILPLRPIFSSIAINTVFYAGLLWVLFAGPSALRRMIRRRRGRCPDCAYPVGQSPFCTECGAAVSQCFPIGDRKRQDST